MYPISRICASLLYIDDAMLGVPAKSLDRLTAKAFCTRIKSYRFAISDPSSPGPGCWRYLLPTAAVYAKGATVLQPQP
ncbi:hypothetical protein G9G63_05020 [Paenibacillus sp. EKM202P]|uniref:hypothetical protein n=1 Tax=Paenibacillus sp. EKM202P TaxID=1683670 RepID=UPI0013EDB04F|nr:hypothetical protein [Paenibacillus sp. EKM202P]KAF6566970.1 hypothetical protein G9G63_05020 [Paenibacillus sp. EKM202P]KAF6572213.1 hypothetical protein G9G64_04195 [Paenibacillus sp. EKM207P]